MQDVGMDKQSRNQGPNSALFEVIQTEDKMLFGKDRILLPCPGAGSDATEDKQ